MKRVSFLILVFGSLAVATAHGQPREKTTSFTFPAELSQVNPSVPLGDKTPLILIHGWNNAGVSAPPQPAVWANFISYFERNPALVNRYKPYYFSFYSNTVSVSTLGGIFRDLIDSAGTADPGFDAKKFVIVGYSIGGLIARSFMEEYRSTRGMFAGARGGERVLNLLTLSTPHHGSPLANGPARDDKVKSTPGVALIVNFFEGYFYASANLQYNQANRLDMLWDNYDNALDYTTFPDERNTYLTQTLNRDTTFDLRIIAYVGTIPSALALDAAGTGSYVLWNGFGYNSDGFVPELSGGFEQHAVQKKTYLSGYDHFQMVKGKTGTSELFDALRNDLLLVTGVQETQPTLPVDFMLSQNFPNPFNPETTIRYAIPVGTYNYTSLRVYDLLGREVATLVNGRKEPGRYATRFDGSGLASGVYYYRLIAAPVDGSTPYSETKKMSLLR